jgi:hypothetical protein
MEGLHTFTVMYVAEGLSDIAGHPKVLQAINLPRPSRERREMVHPDVSASATSGSDGKHVSSTPYQPAPCHPPLLLSTSTIPLQPSPYINLRCEYLNFSSFPLPYGVPFVYESGVYCSRWMSSIRCRLPSKRFSSTPLSSRLRPRLTIILLNWIKRCVC